MVRILLECFLVFCIFAQYSFLIFTIKFCCRLSKRKIRNIHGQALAMEDYTSLDLPLSSGSTAHHLTTSGLTTPDSGIEVLENSSRSATQYSANETPTPSRISLPWYDSIVRRAMTFLNWARPQPGGTDSGFGSATSASFGSTWLLPTESTPYVSNQQQSEEELALVDSQHARITSLTVETIDNHVIDTVSNV